MNHTPGGLATSFWGLGGHNGRLGAQSTLGGVASSLAVLEVVKSRGGEQEKMKNHASGAIRQKYQRGEGRRRKNWIGGRETV